MHATNLFFRLSAVSLVLAVGTIGAEEVNDGPDVTHFPTLVGYRGQPIPVYAKVQEKDHAIASVNLYVAQTPQDVTTKIPMLSSSEDHYNGTIVPAQIGGNDKIWYFIATYDAATNLTQTRWYPVTIKDPDLRSADAEHIPITGNAGPSGTTIPAGETTGLSYGGFGYKEAGLVGGAVVAGAIVAGAVGGGGGGSGFDDSNTVSVPSTGRSSGGFSSAPQDRVIDGTAAIRGRTIRGVRVTLNYQAYFVPDRFQIVYNDSVIKDTGVVSGSDTIQATARGTSPIVIIRVITPQGGTAWDWTATVEYSVVEAE